MRVRAGGGPRLSVSRLDRAMASQTPPPEGSCPRDRTPLGSGSGGGSRNGEAANVPQLIPLPQADTG